MSALTVSWELALTWLAASVTFASLIAVATLGLELLAAANRRPRRFVWLGALAMVVIWPIVGWTMMPRKAPEWVVYPAVTASAASTPSRGQGVALTDAPAGTVADRMADRLAGLPPVPTVLTVWGVLSGLLALLALRGLVVLWRTRREARRDELLGVPILRTRDVGPAVIGVHRTALLMPDWLWELDECLQRLVLQHEIEHRRAGDPWLVWFGVAATLLTPWNPAVWFMAQRLRLAMEIDCDARTLRALPEAASQYPRLLLLIAHLRRRPRLVPLLVPSSSQLARRLHAMTSSTPLRSPIARLAVGAFTLAVANAACSRQIAGNLAGPAVPQVLESVLEERVVEPVEDTTASGMTERKLVRNAVVKARGEQRPVSQPVRQTFEARLDSQSAPSRRADATQSLPADSVISAPSSIVLEERVLPRETRRVPLEWPSRVVYSEERVNALGPREIRLAPRPTMMAQPQQLVERRVPVGPGPALSEVRGILNGRRVPGAFFDFEVDKPAVVQASSPHPIYPPEARSRGVEGEVHAQFVVDTDGRVLAGSYVELRSSGPQFSAAVKDWIAQARFNPAQRGGRAVRQLKQMPFEFRLNR